MPRAGETPDPPLQPLRVPAGWAVRYNGALFEVDPSPGAVLERDRWWVFKEDMLMLVHERAGRLLDVGWYPEGDLERGRYVLALHAGDHRGALLRRFETRDRMELVAEIERLLALVERGGL